MGRMVMVEEGTTFGEVARDFADELEGTILLARQGNQLRELCNVVRDAEPITFFDLTNPDGMRVYRRGASFLLVKAVEELFGEDALVVIEHSLRGNLYCELRKPAIENDAQLARKLEEKMKEYVARDMPIVKRTFRKDVAREMVRKQGMMDKAELFRFRRASNINLYELDGFYDYFYGYMPLSTKDVSLFAIEPSGSGFFLCLPERQAPTAVSEVQSAKKIQEVFLEQMKWCQLLEVSNVGELNTAITHGEFGDLIRINEALHEKKIAEIADQIHQRIDTVKIILIAGPSSSGKTSFMNRLSVQLRVLGIRPHKLSLDDYFVNRNDSPLDEFGNRDLESVYALDLPVLNRDLEKIISGEQVELPTYNFVTGKREYKGNTIHLQHDEILLVEGIHGLNDMLTESIPNESKFKIFISALTQLNVDDHNRISTSDSRLIRRMVRDNQFRGRDAQSTIESWYSVTRGEEENIFPFQENADVVFNSATVYELSVLKQYAEPLLFCIQPDQPEYVTAKRLIKFLGYFLAAPPTDIPNNSLIKEFVGGSCFKV